MLARRIAADLIFVSPVFATRSHPGAKPLGRARLGLLVGNQRARTIALGGMTAQRAQSLSALRLHGWAAIDAWGS
jgi:thiamine-phosphate pyrophosphorylase